MSQTFACYNYNIEIFEEGGFYNIIVRFPNGKALTAYSIEKDDPELILRPIDEHKDLRECIYKHIALEPQMKASEKVIPIKEASENITEATPKAETSLLALGLELYDKGFNVIPVNENKQPLTSWDSSKRIDREELAVLLKNAKGIAIAGGSENPFKPVSVLVLIDIDKPSEIEKYPTLRKLIERTVSWKTGIRCPKCEAKKIGKDIEVIEPGRRFKCLRCNTEFSINEAKRGMGLIVAVSREAGEKLLRSTIRGSVELLVNNYQLIPLSVHPSGVSYEWIKPFDLEKPSAGIYTLLDSELEQLLSELGVTHATEKQEEPPRSTKSNELRRLNDTEKLKLINLVSGVYKPGARQYIWLFLSGWGAKAGIDPVSIAEVLKAVYEKQQDEEPLRMRTGAIVYSYKKAGISLEQYGEELEKLLGVKPYGLEKEINEDEIKGKTGIQEVIESVVGEEEKALEMIKEMEEVFNSASPYKDAIIELLDYEKQLYAVANLRKLITCRARKSEDKLVYKEKVFVGAPTEIVVYVNPIGGITKYQVKWEAPTRTRPIVLGPTLLESITDRLKAEGLVLNSRLASDILSAVVNGFIKRGKAQMKEEIESPGFYFIDGKLIAIKYEAKEPSAEELKEALLLLNELAENWFKGMIDRFAPAVKWGSIAPFIYAYKQKGKWVRYEYHFGSSYTGKTTLGIIVLKIWGLREEEANKPGASLDSPARLGYTISKSTFPVVIREPGGMLNKEEIVEMIKSSAEGLIARSIIQRGNQLDFPALAPLFFTSNTFLPRDDALLRRFSVRHYSYGERIPLEKAREFEKTVLPKLGKLEAIGRFIGNYTLKNGLQEDPDEHATKVLSEAYKFAGLEVPEWLKYPIEETGSETEYFEDIKELIRNYIVKRVNEEFSKNIQKLVGEVYSSSGFQEGFYKKGEAEFADRLMNVLDKQLIPWLIRKDEEVYITSGFVKEIEPLVGNVGGLKSLAELLGWDYIHKKTIRQRIEEPGDNPLAAQGKRIERSVVSVIKTSLKELVDFLSPSFEDSEEQEESE